MRAVCSNRLLLDLGHLHVEGQVDQHGARAAAKGARVVRREAVAAKPVARVVRGPRRAALAAQQFSAAVHDGFRGLTAREDIDGVLLLSAHFFGAQPIYAACDQGKAVYCAAAIDLAQNQFGPLTGMVNNAGIVGAVGSIMETSAEAFDFTMAILSRAVPTRSECQARTT